MRTATSALKIVNNMNWFNKFFFPRIQTFSFVKCKRLLADRINESLNKFSMRTQRLLILGAGVGFVITCIYQIYNSSTERAGPIELHPLTLPKDLRDDLTAAKYPDRVIGVLVPNQGTSGDSLWIATSAGHRFFINNRIRWLEVPLDSLRSFRDTHQYVPLK